METCWKLEIWNGNSQKCKPSEMESLSQKVWNLKWKLSEMETRRMATSEMEKRHLSEMKTFRKATSEMEISTLRHGNFHRIWYLKWKPSEIKTIRKLKSEKETLRAGHHQKKCICSQINIVWNGTFNTQKWTPEYDPNTNKLLKFLIVLPQPKAHPKPLRPESCSPTFPQKKPEA